MLPDPVYGSKCVTRFINKVMLDGKKVLKSIVYDAFDDYSFQNGKDPLEVFEQALENVMPILEVRARRVGGANYQVLIEVHRSSFDAGDPLDGDIRSSTQRTHHARAGGR